MGSRAVLAPHSDSLLGNEMPVSLRLFRVLADAQRGRIPGDLDASGIVDLGDRDEWLRQTNFEQGDFDFDGRVDAGDLNALGTRWTANDLTSYSQGDSNGDGTADAQELNFLASNWNAGTEPAAAVPEPNSVVLMLFGLVSAFAIRRQPR